MYPVLLATKSYFQCAKSNRDESTETETLLDCFTCLFIFCYLLQLNLTSSPRVEKGRVFSPPLFRYVDKVIDILSNVKHICETAKLFLSEGRKKTLNSLRNVMKTFIRLKSYSIDLMQ